MVYGSADTPVGIERRFDAKQIRADKSVGAPLGDGEFEKVVVVLFFGLDGFDER